MGNHAFLFIPVLYYNFGMPKIVLNQVTFAYRLNRNEDFLALDGVSATFLDAAFNVLIGPSGSGKTTLLRALSGLSEYEGEIFFDRLNMADTPPQKRSLAYVSQNFKLYPSMTVFENIAFPLKVMKTPREEAIPKVYALASLFDIQDCLTRKPRHLSQGQNQRVALARALIKDPKTLLLDEPFSNLDRSSRERFLKMVVDATHQKKMTTIYVTHDFKEALFSGEHLVVLDEGKVIAQGGAQEIYASPHPTIAAMRLDQEMGIPRDEAKDAKR